MNPRRDRDEIRRLEAYCEELEDAIDDFEHHLRRCRDRLEGTASTTNDIHQRIAQLERNRRANIKELEKARRQLERLTGAPERGDAE